MLLDLESEKVFYSEMLASPKIVDLTKEEIQQRIDFLTEQINLIQIEFTS